MSQTTPPLNSETKLFWERVHLWKKTYPFWAITPAHQPVPSLIDNPGPFGRYHRISQDEHAYWAFKELAHRDAFSTAYSAESWQP